MLRFVIWKQPNLAVYEHSKKHNDFTEGQIVLEGFRFSVIIVLTEVDL